MSERNTKKYVLKGGNKIVYVGITNNPECRKAEHKQDKDFDKMVIISRKSTQEGAKAMGSQ